MKGVLNHPLVSVVLCTFNDTEYISKTIDSVLNQSFRDFEFIIWNDGSTDSSVERIIKSFSDERIHYYYHRNTGLGMALKMACEKAKGEYIARIDGDDIAMPFRLEQEVSFLQTHPKYVVVSSAVEYIDTNGTPIGRSFPYTLWPNIKKRVMHSSVMCHPASMFRRAAYFESGGYLNIRNGQDRILWSKMIRYGKFYNIKTPLLQYRIQPKSISSMSRASGYGMILANIRSKISADNPVDEFDIDLLNAIFNHSKEIAVEKKIVDNRTKYNKALGFKLYSLLSKPFGPKVAQSVVCFFHDLVGMLLIR